VDIDSVSSRIAFAVAATINSSDGNPTVEEMKQAVAFVLDEASTADRVVTAELTEKVKVLQVDLMLSLRNNAFITTQSEKAREENQSLRRLLAFHYSGTKLYHDDGELQDNSAHPLIDFKRDTPHEIREKMFIRYNPWAVTDAERAEFQALDAKPERDRTLEEISRRAVLMEKINRQTAILQAIH
jgi:hypothetical protein